MLSNRLGLALTLCSWRRGADVRLARPKQLGSTRRPIRSLRLDNVVRSGRYLRTDKQLVFEKTHVRDRHFGRGPFPRLSDSTLVRGFPFRNHSNTTMCPFSRS